MAKAKSARSKKGAAPKTAPPAVMPSETRRSLGFLSALCGCALLVLSLASYSASDPAFSRRSSVADVANWCGRWGAHASDLLYQVFGYTAWAVLPLAGWLWLRFARRPAGSAIRLVNLAFAGWWVATLLGLLNYDAVGADFPAGGLFGDVFAGILLETIGTGGAYLVTAVALLAAATVSFGIDWETLAERGVGVVEIVTPRAASALAALGGRTASGAWGLTKASSRRFVDALRPIARIPLEEADEDELWEELPEERAPVLPGGVPSGPDPVVGGLAIAIHGEPDVVVEAGLTQVDFDVAAPFTPRPTAPGQRDLVEVQLTESGVDAGVASTYDLPSVPDLLEQARAERRPSVVEEPGVVAPLLIDPVSLTGEPASSFDAPEPPAHLIRPSPTLEPVLEDSAADIRPALLESGSDYDDDDLVVAPEITTPFELPELGLLDKHERSAGQLDERELKTLATTLEETLRNFKVDGRVTAIQPGPVITIFEYLPAPGIKVSKIAGLADDIAMAMRALRVRIVAPIPGRGCVGIEIPSKHRQTVWFRDMLASPEFREKSWTLPMALGKTVEGRPAIADLTKMPHLLVGGTTGSGKSVGVNAMLMTMLYSRTPEELRLILIDPKMLEFELYQDIPHLLHPVVTEPALAAAALKWAVEEMEHRYRTLSRWQVRNIASYNKKVERELGDWNERKERRFRPRKQPEGQRYVPKRMPFIVVVIDELADLMMVAAKEVEDSIIRLAQKARACGIHLIVATQRPSVDVITGLIKANMPSRIAYQVRSRTDGRTILDQNGAETLLGKGDMLYLPPGVSALQRLHGPFVTDEECQRVAEFVRDQAEPDYSADIRVEEKEGQGDLFDDDVDDVYDLAVQIVSEAGKASTSMIQRRLKIGYNRAARIIEMMEREGVVGPADGARPRKVLAGPI